MVTHDVESGQKEQGIQDVNRDTEATAGNHTRPPGWRGTLSRLQERSAVELRGCTPIPFDERTETNYFNIFTLWFSMSCNPLPYVLDQLH
jgi:hypothetical protein